MHVSARLVLAMLVGTSIAHAAPTLDPWVGTETRKAVSALLANISPNGAATGAVVASPSQSNPNYFAYWIRDAALTMDTVVSLAERDPQAGYDRRLREYVDFSRRNQLTPNRSGSPGDTGLGEPKFNADGTAFNGDWGRPQNDGPALRAITLIHYARNLMKIGQGDYVRARLYDSRIPTESVIKADLEFVSHHWRDRSFDLWEEVRGNHFYTRAVQRRALREGAALARELGDPGAADWYGVQADSISVELEHHWSPARGYMLETLDGEGHLEKTSGLDVGVILGALHGELRDSSFGPTDDRILITAERLRLACAQVFHVNAEHVDSQGEQMATAIGRYPEDRYSGNDSPGPGNPWVLATLAYAELYERAANDWQRAQEILITERNADLLARVLSPGRRVLQPGEKLRPADPRFWDLLNGLRRTSETYLRRVRQHANPDGSLSEQIQRDSGFMHGARDLTWSYAAFLTATFARHGR